MLKHNKKRNAGIVYEQLLNFTARLVANKKQEEARYVTSLIRRFYHKGSPLNQEKKMFETLAKTKNLSKESAEQVIAETLREIKVINWQKSETLKNKLISEVNKNISKVFWNSPIKNYKLLSSIQILINEHKNGFRDTTPVERVKIHNFLVETLGQPLQVKEKPVDNLTFNILMNKFNKRYSQLINEDQREILRTWILGSLDHKSDYTKLYEAKARSIQAKLDKFAAKKAVKEKDFYPLLQESITKIRTMDVKTMDETKVYELMKFYDLVEDLEEEFR